MIFNKIATICMTLLLLVSGLASALPYNWDFSQPIIPLPEIDFTGTQDTLKDFAAENTVFLSVKLAEYQQKYDTYIVIQNDAEVKLADLYADLGTALAQNDKSTLNSLKFEFAGFQSVIKTYAQTSAKYAQEVKAIHETHALVNKFTVLSLAFQGISSAIQTALDQINAALTPEKVIPAPANAAPQLTEGVVIPVTLVAGQAGTFTVAATDADGDALTYSWDFGDGTTANTASVEKAYAATGTYTVMVKVSDPSGANAQMTKGVVVTAPPVVVDTDADGVADTSDNCKDATNADQKDTDGDKIGDACDSDTKFQEVIKYDELITRLKQHDDDYNYYKKKYQKAMDEEDDQDIKKYKQKLEDIDDKLKDLDKEAKTLEDEVQTDITDQQKKDKLLDDLDNLRSDIDTLRGKIDEALNPKKQNTATSETTTSSLPTNAKPSDTKVEIVPFASPQGTSADATTGWDEFQPLAWLVGGIVILLAGIVFLLAMLLRK